MLSSFIKAWVAFIVMLVVLVALIFGGEYLQERYGNTTFLALAGAAFVVLLAAGLYLRQSRRRP